MYIAILGRQPKLGIAELERVYGPAETRWFSDVSAMVETKGFDLGGLGGTQKAGKVVLEINRGDWRKTSMQIVRHYEKAWAGFDGKITLGISAYGFSVSSNEVQKTGIILKQKLKGRAASLRLIPNSEPALNTAASHHNKLGLSDNKVELLVVQNKNGQVVVAESIGAQNITAYTKRDQERPKRDAFVGMLPPKLAQIMINLAAPNMSSRHDSPSSGELPTPATPVAASETEEAVVMSSEQNARILDPFCGTGVVLQEAALMGYSVYGTDLSEKMIRYTRDNLNWLEETHNARFDWYLHEGDATETTWQQPIGAVVCEGYLGQPFSAPPAPEKLAAVQKNCDQIMSSFLKNIATQIKPGTLLCVAVPAWRDSKGNFSHLPLVETVGQLGYKRLGFKNLTPEDLVYYREDQIVARELLVLERA